MVRPHQKIQGDGDRVAVHAVSCEPVSRFPVYQANIREFIANLVLVWQNPAAKRLLFNSLAADSLRTETGKVCSGSGNPK
jgi:hypothetical protein